jgi:hypothetical protein
MSSQKLHHVIVKVGTTIVLILACVSGFAQEIAMAEDTEARLAEAGWIANSLVLLLTYVVFPLTFLAVIVGAGLVAFAIVADGKTEVGKFRRLVGALLPLILLSAAVAMNFDSYRVIVDYASSTSLWMRFGCGAVACIVMLELGRQLDEIQSDGIMALYAMLASSVAAFLIWAFTVQVLQTLGAELLGFVVGGSFHIIFRGHAIFEKKKAGR